jgi:very-short-patch-repair endonuclease
LVLFAWQTFFEVKFKRQVPIGRYIVDFVCLTHRLVIEVDGGQHNPQIDAPRDAWLTSQGFRVLHFWNHDVLLQTQAVLEAIRLALESPSPPAPPARGRGERNLKQKPKLKA